MPTRWETYPVKFEGGWRTDLGRLDHGVQAPGSATTLDNFEPSVDGGYRKIQGYAKFSAVDVDVAEVGNVVGVAVVELDKALARKGDNYYTSTGTTWTEVLTAPTGGANKFRFDNYNFNGSEKFVVVDGVEDPAFYDVGAGTMAYDISAPTDVTGAHIVKVFKNHIFFAKENLLTFTEPYTDNGYDPGDGSGVINVGHVITGLIVFRDQLIIFTTDTILRLSGNTLLDFELNPITSKTGCLDPDTVQEVGGDIMYLGPDGIRWLSATERNNDFGLERASSNIQSKALSIITSGASYASLPVRAKNQYRLFTYIENRPRSLSEGLIATKFSDQGTTNIAWSRMLGMKVYSVHSRQFSDREVIFFTSETGYVYRMDFGNSFDGEPIRAVFETPYMPINDPRVRKTIYKHTLYLKTQGAFGFTVNLRFDYNPSGTIQPPGFTLASETGVGIWGQSTWGQFTYSRAVSDTFINQTVGSGFVVAIKYEDNSTNPPFTLDYVILEYGTNERR
jgi:hypothetical protein